MVDVVLSNGMDASCLELTRVGHRLGGPSRCKEYIPVLPFFLHERMTFSSQRRPLTMCFGIFF